MIDVRWLQQGEDCIGECDNCHQIGRKLWNTTINDPDDKYYCRECWLDFIKHGVKGKGTVPGN